MATKYILAGTQQHRIWKYATWGLFIVVVMLVAFAYVDTGTIDIGDNSYNLSMIRIAKAVSFGVAILGLQCVVGFTGQVALGQSFFVGTGAYITAWLVADHQWPYLLTLVVVPVILTYIDTFSRKVSGLFPKPPEEDDAAAAE